MTPYFACYLVLVVSLGTGLLFNKLRLSAIVAFVPMFLLITLRGIVGTDSAVYIQSFDVIRYQGVLASNFEPGFTILIEVLSWFFRDSFDILILLGSVTAIITLFAGLLLERSPLFFMAIVLPYFLLDMSMNGLRYGLAFAIVALGAAALARGWLKAFIACSVIAASIQISSVLLAASLWALMEARIRTFLAVGFGATAALLIFGDYIGEKLYQNSGIFGIGGISGIAPLIATIVIAGSLYVSKELIKANKFALLAIVVMQLISFLIAREYYAGLRLQGICLFLLYIFIAALNRKYNNDTTLLNRISRFMLILAVIILSASRLKNFSDDMDGLSPFNPFYLAKDVVALQ